MSMGDGISDSLECVTLAVGVNRMIRDNHVKAMFPSLTKPRKTKVKRMLYSFPGRFATYDHSLMSAGGISAMGEW